MKDDPLRSSLDDLKDRLTLRALDFVGGVGWSLRALEAAAKEEGASNAQIAAVFPRGPIDAVVHYSDLCDEEASMAIEALREQGLKVRERVTRAVRQRIEMLTDHKLAAKRAAAMLTFPLHAGDAVLCLARTSDCLWRAVGDTSTDFNYYTKRLILGGVYSSTLVHWFTDQSDGAQDTWDFLDRRINDVMTFEKVKAGVGDVAVKMPNPFKILGRLRYPGQF